MINQNKKRIVLVDDKATCCGCGCCVLSCPQKAITMIEGDLGSLYPKINNDKCIMCGICLNVCAFKYKLESNSNEIFTYAATWKDKIEIAKSASGGIFAGIANAFINDGGIVIGCSMENIGFKLQPIHIAITQNDDIIKLQGSKYIQSDITGIFEKIKSYLNDNKKVLFTGTPCQVEAIHSYLRNTDTHKLFTIDIICHGVPSYRLFSDYIRYEEEKNKIKIKSFFFRDKSNGWGLTARYEYFDKKGLHQRLLPSDMSSYYSFFLQSEIYRDSCYNCKFASSNRIGDITIGDYWCIEKEHPEYLNTNGGKLEFSNGISCILVNNEQGQSLLNRYGNKLILERSELSKVAKWNHQLSYPSKHSSLRNKILTAYLRDGYFGIEKIYKKKLGLRYYIKYIKYWLKNLKYL